MNAANLNGPETVRGAARGWNHPVWLGFVLVVVGATSYFLVFVRYPLLRDFPWLNLPLVLAGLLLVAWGVRRAFDQGRTLGAKIAAALALLLSLALAGLFTTYIFYLSYQLPADRGVAQIQTVAAEFALQDQNQHTVRLSDYRGQKVVLVFYRGFW